MMQCKYNSSYVIPVPVLKIKITHPISGESEKEIKCKLDTGADRTTIPKSIIAKLGFQPKTHEPVKDYLGRIEYRPVYFADILIFNHRFLRMKVLSTNNNVGLIGRDILNQWVILLDGKRNLFYIADKVQRFLNLFWVKP